MEKRKAACLSLAFLSGIAAAEYRRQFLWYGVALFVFLWFVSMKQAYGIRAKTFLWTAVFAAALCSGVYVSGRHSRFLHAYETVWNDQEKCLVQGEIYKREIKQEANLYYLKNCRLKIGQSQYSTNHILLNRKTDENSIGEILTIKGTIHTFSSPCNEGNYDEKSYYQSLNIDVQVDETEVISVHGKKDVLREALFGLKERLKESYRKAMPEKDAGVLTAMTLGDKSLMDAKRRKTYQSADISHFYSISGLHISMLGMALYSLLRKRGKSYAVSGAAAAVLLFGYGEMIGFSVSASRAIGMSVLLLYAKFRGRSYDRMTALALLAAYFAAKNPKILHHAGYLLSFGAVAGVIFAEWMVSCRQRDSPMPFCRIREGLLVSFCIQLMTVPIMCRFFYEISVYSVLVNLAVLPCMGVLLGMGLFGGLMGCFCSFSGKVLLYPCHLILQLFDQVCIASLQLPFSSLITGALSWSQMLLWYGLLAFLLIWKKKKQNLSVLLFLLPVCILLPTPAQSSWEADLLDVGQGDGIYLALGDGTSAFIDGGSSDVSKVGTYRILPFLKYRGIRQIDYWFVSHCDADHINGLSEAVQEGYPIRNLVVSKYMPDDAAWKKLKTLVKKRGIPILYMKPGDTIRGRKNDWSIRCLSVPMEGAKNGRNENSLAIFLQVDSVTAFFAGDIGEEEEQKLLKRWSLPNVDLYKASHHGSDGSNGTMLLSRIQPRVAVISCSMRNRYGHPGTHALRRLEEACGRIYETRTMGQIKIRGRNLEVTGMSVLE